MSRDDPEKLPRLYAGHDLAAGTTFDLAPPQAHYLRNVLRRNAGDRVRLFNGRDGEWLAELASADKKSAGVRLGRKLKDQPADAGETHLLFTPLKKHALDFLVEKAVELGVTHLHPVLTQNTEARRINGDRLRQQIIEAAEQCERLTLPALMKLEDLSRKLADWDKDIPLYACLERTGAKKLAGPFSDKAAFLIGPEGGFTTEEKTRLSDLSYVIAVQLGEGILRAETAALYCLSVRRLAEAD